MALKLSTGLTNALLSTGSLKSVMEGAGAAGFLIDIYSGTRPTSPDNAATGTKLLTLSSDGAGAGAHFAASASAGALAKLGTETWSGTGLANGTAGYYRLRLTTDAGTSDSSSAVRIDGTIATSGGDLNMTSTTVVSGAPFSVSSASFTMPAA